MDCSKWVPDTWPLETRLWFYTANVPLTQVQQSQVLDVGKRFFEQWMAHGQPLSASWFMPIPQLIVMGVFPGVAPSGCSLDKATAMVAGLDRDFGLDLRNRKRLVWVGETDVVVAEPRQLRSQPKQGLGWLNIYVSTAIEFRSNPILNPETPWIQRMFKAVSAP